jgi:hypothetical protein
MTVPEALGLIREVGGVEIRGGNLRVKFPEKDRARLQPALHTLRRCKDEALAMVAAPSPLGGKLTLLPAGSRFKPTSEKQWLKDAADKVFAEHRKGQAARYAGMSLEQKEEIARQTERADRIPKGRRRPRLRHRDGSRHDAGAALRWRKLSLATR